MKLSAFIKRVREHTGQLNPKIIFTTLNTSTDKLNSGGADFYIEHRRSYHDESALGSALKKGDYYIIEVGMESET